MKSTSVFLALFGTFWTLFVGAMDTFFVRRLVQQATSTHYPSVEGRITHSELTVHRGSKGGSTYGVNIAYSYEVNGRRFEGNRYRFTEGSSSDSAWARKALATFHTGATARVYYRADDPGVSLLDPGVDGSDLIFVLFGLPFNAVALAFLRAGSSVLIRTLMGKGDEPEGLRSVLGSGEQRVSLSQLAVFDAGLAGMGGAGFVLMFATILGFGGFHPPTAIAAGSISIAVCVGVACALWHWARLRSGRLDLVVNRLDGRIEIPACQGRNEARSIPTSRIHDVSVEEVVQRTSKGGKSVTYVPTLHLGAPSETVSLAAWYSAGRARRLAAWLKRVLAGDN